VEDLFDSTRDRWQKSYRYPFYLRHMWVAGIGIVIAAIVMRHRIRETFVSDPRIGWAVAGGIALLVLWCLWTTLQAWRCKILISPTAVKARLLFSGRQRISWEHMEEVRYRWRPLGHTIVLVGADGATVAFRSSIAKYDEMLDFIRANAPEHIVQQLDEIFGEDEFDDDELDDDKDRDDEQPERETSDPKQGDDPDKADS